MTPPSMTEISPQVHFGDRLRRGRALRGLSLRALSEQLGGIVSHAALQKYEKGEMMPSSAVLIAVSDALELRPDYFFEFHPVTLSGIEFRKRTAFGKKKQEQVAEAAREFFERYLEIERILGLKAPPLHREDLRDLDGAELFEGAEDAAAKLRKHWKLGSGPLSNVMELLEDHGVKVKEVEADGSFDGLSGWADGSPVIVMASWLDKDLPRKRLTALHELGHLALRLPPSIGKKAEETVCYRFAGAMLLPKEPFIAEFGSKRHFPNISLQELVALKEQWGISIGGVMRRAKDLGIVTEESYKRFCVHAGASGLRKDEPGAWLGSETSSRYCQLVHRASALELVTRSKAAGLLGVTLRQFDEQYGKAA